MLYAIFTLSILVLCCDLSCSLVFWGNKVLHTRTTLKPTSLNLCLNPDAAKRLELHGKSIDPEEMKARQTFKYEWQNGDNVVGDGLFCGAKFSIFVNNSIDNYKIMCRVSKHSVILMNLDCNALLTAPVRFLKALNGEPPSQDAKECTVTQMLQYFDIHNVESISILYPTLKGPLVYDTISTHKYGWINDVNHPHLVINYYRNSGLDSAVFQCTSMPWSPHNTPLKMFLSNGNGDANLKLWSKSMSKPTVVDLSRMATCPRALLSKWFVEKRVITFATSKSEVLTCMSQMMLSFMYLNGGEDGGDGFQDQYPDLNEDEVDTALALF